MARQKTATFRFDPETHSLLDQLAQEYGQNKTQVLKRMIREETVRNDLLKRTPKVEPPNYKSWEDEEDIESPVPLPKRIRVTGYSGAGYWYSDRVGEEFTVTGREGMDYIVDVFREPGTYYVSISDCEVVE